MTKREILEKGFREESFLLDIISDCKVTKLIFDIKKLDCFMTVTVIDGKHYSFNVTERYFFERSSLISHIDNPLIPLAKEFIIDYLLDLSIVTGIPIE